MPMETELQSDYEGSNPLRGNAVPLQGSGHNSAREDLKMKILQKGFTKNEFSIQLEDWSEDFDVFKYKYTIGAYPRGKWRNRVRCQCSFVNKNEATNAFKQLLEGNKTVFDYDFTIMQMGGNRISIKDVKWERV